MNPARTVYEKALSLLGEASGENSSRLEAAAVDLVNVLLGELFELNQLLRGEEGTPREAIPQIASLEEQIGYEEVLSLTVMPLGLAALLIQHENAAQASFFYQTYLRETEALRTRSRKGRRHKIRRPY